MRYRVWRLFGLLLTHSLLVTVAIAQSDPKSVTIKSDVIYGRRADMALTLDVFTPASPNGIGIIHLAIGGWHKAHYDPSTFAELTKRGYTVFRVLLPSEPKFTVAEQAVDLQRAVRYVRYHAKDYGVDPDRLGITGASAGGHMSMLQANAGDAGQPDAPDPVDRTSSRIQAVACFFPLTDFLNYGGPGLVQAGDLGPLTYHRASFDFHDFDPQTRTYVKVSDDTRRKELLKQVSPITYVTKESPPTFLIHGDKDLVVPLQQSEVIVAKLREVGVPVELVVIKDGGHGWSDFWGVDGYRLADWFDKQLKEKK